ncbi:MAG: hypothetical protein R3F39_09070 [Myxococcota bacterium]
MRSLTLTARTARFGLGNIVACAAFCVLVSSLSACAHSKPAQTTTEAPEDSHYPTVEWKGFTFRAGQKVRIENRAGTFKPVDTGAATDVVAAPGHLGVVLGGETRKPSAHFTPPANEPIQLLRVRWFKQTWKTETGASVPLGEFESTIHVEYLRTAD